MTKNISQKQMTTFNLDTTILPFIVSNRKSYKHKHMKHKDSDHSHMNMSIGILSIENSSI